MQRNKMETAKEKLLMDKMKYWVEPRVLMRSMRAFEEGLRSGEFF